MLHIISADAVIGPVAVDDVITLDALSRRHFVIAGDGVLNDQERTLLGDRLLDVRGPPVSLGWRDVRALDDMQRTVRDLARRHGRVVVHAHGARARGLSSLLADVVVVVDDGDGVDAHRLLPSPLRTVYASHGDLDRALERGFTARSASLVPPGIDTAPTIPALDHVVLAFDVAGPHVARALTQARLTVTSSMVPQQTCSARLLVCGPETRFGPGILSALASGVRCLGIGAVWADDVRACAAFLPRTVLDLEEMVRLALSPNRARPRRMPRALGRHARTVALNEVYDSVGGPEVVLKPRPMRRRPRR